MIKKLIDTLNTLSMNEDPAELIAIMPSLFENLTTLDLVKSLYCLILSQCFYAKETKFQ